MDLTMARPYPGMLFWSIVRDGNISSYAVPSDPVVEAELRTEVAQGGRNQNVYELRVLAFRPLQCVVLFC